MEHFDTIVQIATGMAAIAATVISIRKFFLSPIQFVMEILFEMLDIMDGKEINGQVKELKKRAYKYNVKHYNIRTERFFATIKEKIDEKNKKYNRIYGNSGTIVFRADNMV